MNRLIFILAFLPLYGFSQNYITYTTVDFESMSVGYVDSAGIETEFGDFTSIRELRYYDSASIVENDGVNTTKFFRAYTPDTTGCCDAFCDEASNPAVFIHAEIDDSTIYNFYASFDFKLSAGFEGGCKVFGVQSPYIEDSCNWVVTMMMENGDSLFRFYYDDYDLSFDATSYTAYTKFTPKHEVWYNITMGVNLGNLDASDGSMTLFVNGIADTVMTGKNFRQTGTDDPFGSVVFKHFFGGGICSPNYPTWINYDNIVAWWPTPLAISNELYPALGEYWSIGDTLTMPADFYCEGWYECEDYYNGEAYECSRTDEITGRTDGVCAEVGGNVFFHKNGSRVYLKKNGINVEWNKN